MAEQLQYANGITILRLIQVKDRTGLSRSTIYDRMNLQSPRYDPTFPSKVELGPGAVGWVESEIDIWLSSKVSANRPAVGNSPPNKEPKQAAPPIIEPVTVKVDVEPPSLDAEQISTVRQFLEHEIKRGTTSIIYPEVMASIHLWEDKPADRVAIAKILETITKTSHAENGVLISSIVHGPMGRNSRPVDAFFDLAKSLGYTFDDLDDFVKEQTKCLYEFYESPANKSKGRIIWLQVRDRIRLTRQGSF